MQNKSLQDKDGTVWTTVGLSLGATGLDLRRPDDPGTMSKLLNARFVDSKTLGRRDGHTGRVIQTKGAFVMDKSVGPGWVYGHGARVVVNGNEGWENAHHPIQTRGGGVFRFGATDVVWTGDRLLVIPEEGPSYGGSYHWGRAGSDTVLQQGIPAFIPVQVDTPPVDAIDGDYMDTCLTEALRVVVSSTADERMLAVITNRETGIAVYRGFIDADDGVVEGCRVVNSGGVPLAFWYSPVAMYSSYWNGVVWSTPLVVALLVEAFDVAAVSGGCHIAYRITAVGAVYVGHFNGSMSTDSPYVYRTALDIGTSNPSAAVAIAADPAGNLAVAWESDGGGGSDVGLFCRGYDPFLTASTLKNLSIEEDWDGGLTVCCRGLANEDGQYPFIVHAGRDGYVFINEVTAMPAPFLILQTDTMFNSKLASRSFCVGDEVFAWLQTTNSSTLYLAAGAYKPNICGYADREVAIDRAVANGAQTLAAVTVDPLSDGTVLTWIRPFNAGQYSHPGDALIGDINFLPELSTAAYGKSLYIAGSNCRNWDGKELGDAGFHDYPIGANQQSNSSGSKTASGVYQVRIYAVRYNAVGERMMGVAVTSPEITLADNGSGMEDTITITINTIPCTNHDDVVFEVYCTEAGQDTFYLETTVVNDRDAETVTATLAMDDAALRTGHLIDSHAPVIGALTELEESAPLGCATLITAGDRLWGIGGQVPAGIAQFSKLFEPGEAAGFDAAAGTQIVDATGGEITSIASFGDARVVAFQRNQLQVITEEGPNNYGVGTFGVPALVVADGAINHAGTAVLPVGIVFWGAGGPRLLTPGFKVLVISEPVRDLTNTMVPSGVRVNRDLSEVIWYTGDGGAVMWNYANGSRWSEWSGLPVAGCSEYHLVTTDGRLLTPSTDATLDDGRRFFFTLATGDIRPEQMLAGHTLARAFALAGEHVGPHRVQFKIYYNGSPLWSDKYKWEPETNTWLTAASVFADMTAAQVDALGTLDQSGAYFTHKRLKRLDCRYFRIEISDCGDAGFMPWELSFELGQKPGLGRTAVNTFTP